MSSCARTSRSRHFDLFALLRVPRTGRRCSSSVQASTPSGRSSFSPSAQASCKHGRCGLPSTTSSRTDRCPVRLTGTISRVKGMILLLFRRSQRDRSEGVEHTFTASLVSPRTAASPVFLERAVQFVDSFDIGLNSLRDPCVDLMLLSAELFLLKKANSSKNIFVIIEKKNKRLIRTTDNKMTTSIDDVDSMAYAAHRALTERDYKTKRRDYSMKELVSVYSFRPRSLELEIRWRDQFHSPVAPRR